MVTLFSFTSYFGLCLVQGAMVLSPGVLRTRLLAALRARWLLIAGPAAVVTAATFLPRVAVVLAVGLSSLALALVPPLAVLGIGWAMRWRDWRLVPLVAPPSAALLVSTFGMSLAAFLLVTNVLPATVPVAAALGVEELSSFRARQHPRRVE